MKTLSALEGGLAGAVALTLIHETIKAVIPQAPRMDLLGKEAISKGLKSLNGNAPGEKQLYAITLTGDLIANAIYYSFAGIGKREDALVKGAALGLAAGLGAVLLPGPLGLDTRYSNRTLETKLITVGLYVAGGIVAAAIMRLLERKKVKRQNAWEQRLVTSAMS